MPCSARIPSVAIWAAACLAGCVSATSPTSVSNTCPSSDDAGAYVGSLFTLDDAGDLTVDLDAGNGGIDLGSMTSNGQTLHTYEWYCLVTADCQSPRDATLTFTSPNGANHWSPDTVTFDSGASCGSVDGSDGGCCVMCTAAAMQLACGNSCVASGTVCTQARGCACQE